jgi:uncharacterized protein YjlB
MTPLATAEIVTRRYPPNGGVPNNPHLPAVVFSGALPPEAGPGAICALFQANGWGGAWTYTVFDYHHYHPNAHEALAVASGSAELHLGGPEGDVFAVAAGDALVLPAGCGHRRLRSSSDFAVCGAYPRGQENYEITRAGAGGFDDAQRIAATPLPATDPIYGRTGPLLDHWS